MKGVGYIYRVLALLLLVSHTGLSFYVHYCEGHFSGVSFSYQLAELCTEEQVCGTSVFEQDGLDKVCCALETTHEKCCENTKVEIKNSTIDKVLFKAVSFAFSPFILANQWGCGFVSGEVPVVVSRDVPAYYCDTHAPPFYKLYSQFLFYDSIIS